MNYSHQLHPEAEEELRFIAKYFMDEASLTVALNFLDAVEDSANRITQELNNRVRRRPKFDEIFAMPIKANPERQNYAKDFSTYMLWYEIDDENQQVVIWSIDSTDRNPELIIQNLRKRKR